MSQRMRIYRAGNAGEIGIKAWASYTPDRETAEAYRDNPGFGGDTIRELVVSDDLSILDADTTTAHGMALFAAEIGLSDDDADRWWMSGYRYPWEDDWRRVRAAIVATGYDAVRYVDDYPEGATTIIFCREDVLDLG
jgi:hypothetical protein